LVHIPLCSIQESGLASKINVFLIAGGLFYLSAPMLSSTQAEALTSQECGVLRAQKLDLETKGLGKTLSKGAIWASSNLDDEQIKEVGVFLELMEKIRFRCGTAKTNVKSKNKRGAGLHANIPLPVRNSRRLKKNIADKKAAKEARVIMDGMARETKAVLSAVTKGGEDGSKDAKFNNSRSSDFVMPKMRKSLEK
jgi:hypothetical protein